MSRTRTQTVRFLVSGVLATAADALAYALLLATVLVGHPDLSKAASFVVGTLIAFVLARAWTFAGAPHRAGQAPAFFALYATAFLLNVATHGVLLRLLLPWLARAADPVAFVVATGASTVLNFFGQKLLVFRGA